MPPLGLTLTVSYSEFRTCLNLFSTQDEVTYKSLYFAVMTMLKIFTKCIAF